MDQNYKQSFFYSLILHGVLFILLVVSFSSPRKQQFSTNKMIQQPEKIIKSVAVSEEDLLKEITKIKQEEANKARQEEVKRLALVRERERIKQQRMNEEKRVALLKKEQRELKRKQRMAESNAKKKLQQLLSKRKQQSLALKKEKARARELQQELDRKQKAIKAKELQAELQKKALLARQARKDALKKKLAQEQEAKVNSEIDKYKALILSAISQNWIIPKGVDKSLSSQFQLELSSTGDIIRLRLIKSSGDELLDRSAKIAIYRAQPLPVPNMPQAFAKFKRISLTVRPEDVFS